MMKKLTLVLAFLTCSLAMSQGMKVQGNVLDGGSDNTPMAFATIKVEGLDISTETDMQGKYELSLLDGDYILIIAFIGYEPVELANVIIENKNVMLSPVVLRSKKFGHDLATIEEQE